MPWFALLLLLPFLAKRYFPPLESSKENNAPEIFFPALDRIKDVFPSGAAPKKRSDRLFFSWLFLAWACLVLALMQPEKVDTFKQIKNEGYDLMLAVDISSSMQAVDFSTEARVLSRLDATKEVVGKFVLGRKGDRVGLVTFGEKAYLHVPLTLDTESVSRMLSDALPGMAGNATAIGDAIGLSIRTLRQRPEGSRVLVLLTDGEDNASSIPPMEAAKLAKKYGIRIYTVGVGKNGQVPFPTKFGGYAMATVSIDERLLKDIAKETGGQYFSATDPEALASIYHQINELEKTESNQEEFFIRDPLYMYPLGLSLLLLIGLAVYPLNPRRALGES